MKSPPGPNRTNGAVDAERGWAALSNVIPAFADPDADHLGVDLSWVVPGSSGQVFGVRYPINRLTVRRISKKIVLWLGCVRK